MLHLLPQAFRFLNDGVLDRAEFFLLRERIVLPGPVFVVAIQRIAYTIPDGIVRRYLRHRFKLVYDRIHQLLQRLLEIAVLLFPADGSQFVRQLQQLLLNGQGWFCDMLYLVNDLPHGLPRRFGHILVSCILPNIQIFKFCLKDLIGHGRTQFYHICPL